MPSSSAETVLRRIVQNAANDVGATEAAAIADEPGGVHRHRTRVRRLRSILGATAKVAGSEETEKLRAALKEWGRQLGEARDAEVRARAAERALAETHVDDADARRRLVDAERTRYRRLHAHLVEVNGYPASTARRALLGHAGAGVGDASGRAAKVFARLLRREARRVHRAATRVDGTPEATHALRKAARRLRHLAEAIDAAAPGVLGSAPRKLAKAGRRIHDILGDRRDERMLRQRVGEARIRAAAAHRAVRPYDALLAALPERAEPRGGRVRPKEARKAVRRIRKVARKLS